MSKAKNNQQLDSDILQCKADILRALNATPLRNDADPKNSQPQNNSTETVKEEIPIKEIPLQPKPTVIKKQETTTSEKISEIPSFDLAKEIMAEQRKFTAIRRKAPGQRNNIQILKPKSQPVNPVGKQPTPSLSEQDKIIADIVARDIERLCQG